MTSQVVDKGGLHPVGAPANLPVMYPRARHPKSKPRLVLDALLMSLVLHSVNKIRLFVTIKLQKGLFKHLV